MLTSLLLTSALLCGCQAASSFTQAPPTAGNPTLHGHVHGGQQPVSNALIGLYAAGTAGAGSAAKSLLSDTVLTDSNGDFELDGLYSCPTPNSEIFITAEGGNPGLAPGLNNPNIGLMATLGPCSELQELPFVNLNEETTVAAVWSLSYLMTSSTNLGSNAGDPLLTDAFVRSQLLVDLSSGTAPGKTSLPGYTVQTSRLNHLADILAACINSRGGIAGDNSVCGRLFSAATPPNQQPSTDTLSAALQIAQYPTQNVSVLFNEIGSLAPFNPTLATAPSDWTLDLAGIPATPTIMAGGEGNSTSGQTVSISDATPNAVIHYTLDGSAPTALSPVYTAPFALSSTTTVSATAILSGLLSSYAVSDITVGPTEVSINVVPSLLTLRPAETQQFTTTVTGSNNSNVQWVLSPAIGSLSATGLYTAPATIAATQTLTVTAICLADKAKQAVASITLVAPVSVSVTPATVSLGSSQTRQFTAGVVNSSNTAVTWSLNPEVGSISTAGLYKAPKTIDSAQTVTVTATSLADPTKLGTATISLTPPVIPASYFGLTVLNFTQLTPSTPFGTTRSWDSWPNLDWSDVNPSAGVYDFTHLDQFITINRARGADIIYTFGRTPRWASSQPNNMTSSYGPGECAPPSDMSYWDNYVKAIATHAAGRIKYWELWNEPNESTYCGDMPTMVTMAQHAAQIIKSVDPTALILTPSPDKATGPAWLSSFLSMGGAGSVDVIAFHGYWSSTAEDIISVVAGFRTVMAANGVANLPMWDTESSWAYTSAMPLPTSATQVGYLAKNYLLHWSQGVARFTWYAYDGQSPWGTLWTSGTGETPAALAYGEMYKWMVGATLTAPCSEAATRIWTCPLSRGAGYFAEAVWISNSSATLTVPAQYTQYVALAGVVHHLLNGTVSVGDQPILLETGAVP